MKKNLFITFLLASFMLIGCNSTKNTSTDDTFIGINKPSQADTTAPDKTLLLTDNTAFNSPYISLGNLIFFPDKENNNRLSTIIEPLSEGYIKQSNIKNIFDYPVESIASIKDLVYFSNGSDGNTLYSLDYPRNEIKKINNNYVFNLTSNLNTLYYINKNNKDKLYFYNTEDLSSGIITNDSFGKFIINGDYILYQNLSDKANLYSVKVDGSNRMKLTDVSVDSFVPYKNEILFLNSDDNNTLYRLNPITLKINPLNSIHGENLKTFDNKLFIIDKDNSNRLSSLTIDFEKNTASTLKLTDDTINDYFPNKNGIFIQKSPDINKTYILK